VKTISVVDGKTKRNLYFIVILLYVIISVFFIINSEYQHRKAKKILVSQAMQNSSSTVGRRVNKISTSLKIPIHIVEKSKEYAEAISTNDTSVIRNALKPLVTSLVEPQNAFFAIYSENGDQLFSNIKLPFCINNEHNYHISRMVVDSIYTFFSCFGTSNMYYVTTRTFSINGSVYNVFSGIKDTDGLRLISDRPRTLPFMVFQHEDKPRRIVTYYGEDTIKAILNKVGDFNNNTLEKQIKIDGDYYVLADATGYFFSDTPSLFNVLFAINISEYAQTYNQYLLRVFIFVFGFLFVLLLTVHLLYNRVINALLKLEKKLEIELIARTRQVIDDNEQLNQIFNATANGVRIIDKNFTVIKVNAAFCKLTGINAEDIVGAKCYEKFPSTSCHTSYCPLEQIQQHGTDVETVDIRYNALNQKIVYQYIAKPFLTKNEQLIGIIEDFKDVTELYNAKESIKQTQQQFDSLHNAMPVGVFIRDFEGNMYYQNPYMDNAFGPVCDGRKNVSSIYPSGVNRFFEEDKIVDKYGSFVGEEKLIDNDGVERTYVTHKFKFIGANKQLLIGGVTIDITKRKKAEHHSFVLTKAIVNSPIGVLITSPEGVVEFFNPEFEKYYGRASENIMGNTFPYCSESDSGTLANIVKQARGGNVYQGELQIDLFSGVDKWYALSVAPVFNRDGIVAHLVFTFDDITERKEYEAKIVIAKAKAEESDRLKTAFLSNLSHEIRTPLNAILGFSSLLSGSDVSNDEREEIAELLVNHSNDLLELINDLIDISAIETNQFVIKKKECQLNKMLTNTFNDVITKNRFSKKSDVKVHIKLGVLEDKFTVLTDAKRLSQVVDHLLSNAIKFTSQGFVELGYTFKDANNLLFYVIDTGVGLTSREKNIIFSPFRQADDSITRGFSGMGLGLAISKHIVERLGGEIWVESTKSQGSTFYFTIPYIPIKTKFDTVVLPFKQKESFNWENKTILVADDIDSNYKFIQILLKPTGAKLLWAKNGQEAVDIVKSSRVDVILMDVVMPKLDGFEATRLIKQINSNIKIICQTAFPEDYSRSESEKVGMDGYLAKPIAPFSILKIIDDFFPKN